MDNIYLKGELLQIHTKENETFEGRFYSMSIDKSRITLYNVRELPKGDEKEGMVHLYETEVLKIVKIKEAEAATALKHLKISEKDCQNIIKTVKKFIFINQVDNSFYEALEDLKQYSYIAVSTDGASMGRKWSMPFLVLSTPQQIYIFDIQVMTYNAFDAGLKQLLESETSKKIVHDCRKLADCLDHKHQTKLNSVFDTQVGDLIVNKNKNGKTPTQVKSLQECLNYYLGLPLSTINDKFDTVQCMERPLIDSIKETLAKNISYLHHLSEVINEEMMLPFVRGVQCYVDNIRTCDDFKAWDLSSKLNQPPKEFSTAIEY